MARANAGTQAKDIAAKGDSVRERIRHTFVETVRNRDLSMERLDKTAQQMIDGAIEGVKQLAPQEQSSTLRKVVDGLADGLATTANATRYALEEARSRGEHFAREDVDQIMKNLRGLQDRFVETINDAAHRAAGELGTQSSTLREHARRAYEGARPAIESAARAALDHPVRFAGESARAGAQALPHAIGTVFHALSGALQGAGDLLTGDDDESDTSSRTQSNKRTGTDGSGKKKTGKKKSGKKSSKSSKQTSSKKKSTKKKSSKKKARGGARKTTKKKSAKKKSGKKNKTKKKSSRKSAAKKAGKKKTARKSTSKSGKKTSKKKSATRKSTRKKSGSKKTSASGKSKSKSKKKKSSRR